jgi:cation:H+ antiporter
MTILLPLIAIAGGIVALMWSAERFISGAAALARHFGLSPLLIGMLIVGFGTSAPEMLVSALASWQGSSGIALGNAFGSNIVNIGLILGVTALLSPVAVHSTVLRRELPILLAVTALVFLLSANLSISRLDALVLLAVFAVLVFWSVHEARTNRGDALIQEVEAESKAHPMPLKEATIWTLVGLALLIGSSRLLVWGAVETALFLGVSDLIIGLTVVAVGTSLPELASSIVAIRRGEHDIALGNVIGSNLFNTLAVVAIAGLISPIAVPPEVLQRDLPVMSLMTIALVATCAGFGRQGRVNRIEGALLLAAFIVYTGYLAVTAGG